MSERTVVGLAPWLPWPLSTWRWWTEPVRAERLAVLRIGLGAVLLLDILISYLPHVHDFYGPDSLANPELVAWVADAPRWQWSLLRGLGDPALSAVALLTWLATTVLVLAALGPRSCDATLPLRWALGVWTVAAVLWALGVWARPGPAPNHETAWLWAGPLVTWGVACLFVLLELRRRPTAQDGRADRQVRGLVLGCWAVTGLVLLFGLWKWANPGPDGRGPQALRWVTARWDQEPQLLLGAMLVWAAAAAMLLLGWQARLSACAAWVLSLAFANLNPSIENAGDTIRCIVLFYLMLSPCGAAWSVDRWRDRRRGLGAALAGPVFVHPWPLRLLFVQMVLMYFCNGLFKLFGYQWREGSSLYYVLCDPVLTRFSFVQLPVPYVVTQVLTWAVLAWEVGFPLWVGLRWTRTLALGFGVAFHLGIWVSMELGSFVPYTLTLYLPLVPWDRLADGKSTRQVR
jgi:hypothetical protein